MKIALVTSTMETGGAERVIALLVNEWVKAGHDVSLLILNRGEIWYHLDPRVQVLQLGIDQQQFSLRSALRHNFLRIQALRRALRVARPDVIVSFIDVTNVITLLAAFGLGVPVVVSERSVPGVREIGPRWEFLRAITYTWATRIVLQSNSVKHFFRSGLRKRAVVIPNPLSEPVEGMPEHTLVQPAILAIGRFTREKRFDVLVQAFQHIAHDFPSWHLYIFGDGPLRLRLDALVKQSGCGERIHLPGKVRAVHQILQQATLFASTSDFEGFPNVVCEALSMGVPVIASHCPGGITDIITDGQNGLFFERSSVRSLESLLRRAMSDGALRQRISSNATAIKEILHADRISALWQDLFIEITKHTSTPAHAVDTKLVTPGV
jgi:GalNAc-alpha-(1->4)-GalNAc-alpha-(1->3)-diNAcBac-PP-undecaprenol alpha-1,4-N-acetyl-D-galactosaminyltransferase